MPYVADCCSLLELGCNVGRNVQWAVNLGMSRVVGVDVNEPALMMARELDYRKDADVKFVHSDAGRFLATQPTFDVVLSKGFLINVRGSRIVRNMASSARKAIVLKERNQDRWSSWRPRLDEVLL